MKLKTLLTGLAIFALLATPLAAFAQEDEAACGVISLFDGWARATPEGAPTGAAYGLLVNLGSEEDTLVSVTTDAAEAVELHEMIMGDGDVMQMRPVEGGFTVAPNTYLQLAPGGLHIMLIGLTAPLEAGGTLNMVLTFEKAGEVALTIPVREMAAMGEQSEMMGTNMGDGEAATPEMMATEMPESEIAAPEWPEGCDKIHIVDPWVRAAVGGMPTSAAYALLLNLTAVDDTLIAAASEAAEAVELHEMLMGEGDVMRMSPVEGGIPVPAGGAAVLQPGGLHIMMIGLTQALDDGGTLDLTLTFENAGEVVVSAPVRQAQMAAMH
jgi:copper(I)-binding protein